MGSITLNDITELKLEEGKGSFDILMRAVRLHIADAVTKNEITQSESGAIYTNVIPTLISESVAYEMKKDLVAQEIEQGKIKISIVQQELELKKQEIRNKAEEIKLAQKNVAVRQEEIVLAKEEVKTKKTKLQLDLEKWEKQSDLMDKDMKLKDKELETEVLKNKTMIKELAIKELEYKIDSEKWEKNKKMIDVDLEIKNKDLKDMDVKSKIMKRELSDAESVGKIRDEKWDKDSGIMDIELDIKGKENKIMSSKEGLLKQELEDMKTDAKLKMDKWDSERVMLSADVKIKEAKVITEQINNDIAKKESKNIEVKGKLLRVEVEGKTEDVDMARQVNPKQIEIKEMEVAKAKMDVADKRIESAIIGDTIYKANKLTIIASEGETAERTAESSGIEKQIKEEQLITEQEKNGKVGYKYVYYYSYMNWKGDKKLLAPSYDSATKVYSAPANPSETVKFYAYVDGNGEWTNTGKDYSATYDVVVKHYNYEEGGSVHQTNVPMALYGSNMKSNQQFVYKDCWVLEDNNGQFVIALETAGAESDTIGWTKEINVTSNVWKLKFVNQDVSAATLDDGGWASLKTDWDADSTVAKFNGIVSFKKVILRTGFDNKNNYGQNVISVNDTAIELSDRAAMSKDFTYVVEEDTHSVYKSEQVSSIVDADEVDDSLVRLQKLELIASTKREDKKVNSSQLPSTY